MPKIYDGIKNLLKFTMTSQIYEHLKSPQKFTNKGFK